VLRELAPQFPPDDLQLYYQIAIQGRGEIGLAPDEYAGFTMTLLRMLAFAPVEQGTATAATSPAVVQRAAAVVSPAPAADSKKNRDDAEWPGLVGRLGLTAMALELARHCELVARDASRVELKISQTHQRLLEKPYQERLKAALEQHFGAKLRLSIQVSADANGSPAAIAGRDNRKRHVQATTEIEQDPFVRELVENFDARVVESSIKPAE
jgi:DNA polymerase-3 subunit gamma/tau